MSLRSHRIEQPVTLPDGRELTIEIGIARDPYIARRDMDTVSVELRRGNEVLAVLNTLLEADDDSEARALARDIAAGLASGDLEPTAEAIEPLADRGG